MSNMKKITIYFKCFVTLFLISPLLLSGQTASEYNANTFLIQFDADTDSQEILDLKTKLLAQELGMTPMNNIRLWKVPQFPIVVNDDDGQIYTLSNIIEVQDFSNRTPKVNGTDLDYSLEDSEGWNLFDFDYSAYYYHPTAFTASASCNYYSLSCDSNVGDVKVGYIDTGLNTDGHEAMFGSYYQEDFNAIEPGSEPEDYHGHGTQMAGIAAATFADKGLGDAIQLVPLKAMDNTGSANLFHIIYAVEMARVMGVEILNLSFGYHPVEGDASELLELAIREATEAGMLVIASAGNDNMNIRNQKFYPACFSNRMDRMITVGGIQCDGQKTDFSNWNRNTVQIGAPAEDILVPIPGGQWAKVDGTSQSAAITTTIAALIATHLVNFNADVIESVILESAYPTNALWNKFSTGGFVDAEVALSLLYYYYGLSEAESEHLMTVSKLRPSTSAVEEAKETNIATMAEAEDTGLSLTAFPNPFVENVHLKIKGVQLEQATIEIFNAAGQLIKTIEKSLSTTNIQVIELNLSELDASGLYHIQLTTGKTILNAKIFKK